MKNKFILSHNGSFVVENVTLEQATQIAKYLCGRYDHARIENEDGDVFVYHRDTNGKFVEDSSED